MAALTKSVSKLTASSRSSRSVRPAARSLVVVSSSSKTAATRREVLGASVAAVSLLLGSGSAHAGIFGFGDDDSQLFANYTSETTNILDKVKVTLAMDKDDPAKEDVVKGLRTDINQWVAKYRREPKVSGKPSFGNTYSALNALAGHFNSFGATAPIPKKRLDRLQKELDDAAMLLTRNR